MNIGIDIDDTIADTFATLLPYSQKFAIEDLKSTQKLNYKCECNNHLYIEAMNNWNEEESKKFWDKYYGEMLEKLDIKKFAAEVINKLKEDGNKIYLITARWHMDNCDTKQITIDWLKANNIQYDELLVDVNDKLEIAIQKKIDIFIDDSFKHCTNIANNSDIKVYMMNSNANASFEDKKVERVFSWPEIQYLVNNAKK